MYDTIQMEHYWTQRAIEIYKTVSDCGEYVRYKLSEKRRRSLQLIPIGGPLQFVVMDILNPVQEKLNGKQFVLVLIGRYTKLKRDVPSSKTTDSHIVSLFMDNVVIPYVPTHVLTDNRNRFISKFFESLCTFWRTQPLTTAAYTLQTDRATESFNKTVITQLRHYVD